MRVRSDWPTGSTFFALLSEPTPERWNAFVDHYTPMIHAWCRAWGLQEADANDLTQEVLLRFYKESKTFVYQPEKGRFRGWLKTVTDNACRDFLKRRQRTGQGSGDSKVDELLANVEAREDLIDRLAKQYDLELREEAKARVRLRVEPKTWEVFRLLLEEGRAATEVAQELHMAVTAIQMAKSRLLKMIREEIGRLQKVHSRHRDSASCEALEP